MSELPLTVGAKRGLDIVDRIAALIAARPVTDFQVHDFLLGPVYELMSDALSRKTCTHTGAQFDFFRLHDKRWFARQHEHKLVLLAVPVKQGRLAAGRELREIYTKVPQAEKIAELPFFPP